MRDILKLNLVTQALGLLVMIPMFTYSFFADDYIMWEPFWITALVILIVTNVSIVISPVINRFLE